VSVISADVEAIRIAENGTVAALLFIKCISYAFQEMGYKLLCFRYMEEH